MFALADCNNFYVSCERIFNPSLNGVPVIVLSNNDGCVISRSNEAKSLGIKMGEPLFKVKDKVDRYNIKVFSSNFELYGDISYRIMERIRDLAPSIEVYSIDEAFLDLSGIGVDKIETLIKDINYKIRKEIGIPLSIGVSNTKTLSKVAAGLCKRYPKLKGCCVMHKEDDIKKVLSNCKVSDIWGIGRSYLNHLNMHGIYNALQFANSNGNWVKKSMTIVGYKIWQEINGSPQYNIEEDVRDKQEICTSRTFSNEIVDIEPLSIAISNFADSCAKKLRDQSSVASCLTVFLLTNRFDSNYSKTVYTFCFDTPTDSSVQLNKAAQSILRKIYSSDRLYKKAGVVVSKIEKRESVVPSLFCDYDINKDHSLMKVIDSMNNKYGRGAIMCASSLNEGVELYSRSSLSPKYTTCWNDIIKVKI